MLILDTFSKIENGKFKVENFHRGHLSLKSGTTLNVLALPGRQSTPMPRLTELIISPISFDSWEKLTRINARIKNRPGVLRKLMLALSRANVNILYHASGPLKNGILQRIEFLVDAKPFYKRFEDLSCDRKMKDFYVLSQLEIWLKSLLVHDLDFDNARARIKVRPMETFRSSWRAYYKFKREEDYPMPIIDKTIIENGLIAVPTSILEILGDSSCGIMLNSDTKDRLLKGLLLSDSSSSTYLRVTFSNLPASSSMICSALAEYFYFLFSLTRIGQLGDSRVLEFMLYSPDMPSQIHDNKRKLLIETVLANPELAHLGITVSYPPSLSGADPEPHKPRGNFKILTTQSRINNLCPDEVHLMDKSSAAILKKRIGDLNQPGFSSDIKTHSDQFSGQLSVRNVTDACRELLSRLDDNELSYSRVFVSFPFAFNDLFDVVRERLERNNLEVVTGKDPRKRGFKSFREVIAERICSCYGFFGIWKYTNNEGLVKFSPWLSWELGVAQSCKMPVRICPHEGMIRDKFIPHRLILPETHMPEFSDLTFPEYVDEIIDDFAHEIKVFARSQLRKGPNFYSNTN